MQAIWRDEINKAYYYSSIESFLAADNDAVLGQLPVNDEFETTDLQKNSWRCEIRILKKHLQM